MADNTATTETAASDSPSCSLTEAGKRDRTSWVQEEIIPLYRRGEFVENGLRATFDASEESIVTLTRFFGKESGCCSSFTFEMTYEPPYDVVTVQITGPDGTRDLIERGLVDEFEQIAANTDDGS